MDERSPRLGRFPYLADDYALVERIAGETPWIADIHVFAIASTMSFGPSGSSINAMTTAVTWATASHGRSRVAARLGRMNRSSRQGPNGWLCRSGELHAWRGRKLSATTSAASSWSVGPTWLYMPKVIEMVEWPKRS